jgi:hypothetical protein
VTTSQVEILAALEKVTSEKWNVTEIEGNSVVAAAREKAERGDMSSLARLIQSVAFRKGEWSNFGHKAVEWNRLLGLDGDETVEETVKRVVKEKSGKA